MKPPYRALWEITAACDLHCEHCLVSAGRKRDTSELDTKEALALVDDLARLGVSVVSLTGGEPLLRKDWLKIATRIREHEMILRISSNGHLLDKAALEELLALKTEVICLSIDGLRATHDRIRHGHSAGRSSFERVTASLELLRCVNIATEVITTVTRENLDQLPSIHQLLKKLEVTRWVIQLGHHTGRLSGSTSLNMVSAEDVLTISDFIVSNADDPLLAPSAFNSIGYLDRDEPILRASGRRDRHPIWRGCRCGVDTLGIEPDGGIKGCANQVGEPFVIGNIRQERLSDMWNDRKRWFWLDPDPESMTGSCKDCALATVCHAGCTVMAYRTTGEFYNNPFCLRALRRSGRI